MEIGRKLAGKRVRCVECGAMTDVPRPGGRRKYTEEEKAFLRSVTEKAEHEQLERERRDDENHPIRPLARGRLWGQDVGMIGGIIMMIVGMIWFVGGLLFLNRLFYFAPVLVVGGVVAVVRGIVNWQPGRKKRRRRRR
jgi:hypothetical protein